jgi:DNA repair exonuclease SbcCD nuclease subunit
MGHYVKDSSSLPPEAYANFRVISGHYHKRQDITCGEPKENAVGLFSYIGNPFTLSFAEAGDPKGIAILLSDGTLQHIELEARRHCIINVTLNKDNKYVLDQRAAHDDLIWVKFYGPQSEVDKFDKMEFGTAYFGHSNFQLDFYPFEAKKVDIQTTSLSHEQMFDDLIDSETDTDDIKQDLKDLWREELNAAS